VHGFGAKPPLGEGVTLGKVNSRKASTTNATHKIKFFSSLSSSISPGYSDINKYLHEILQRYSAYIIYVK